MKKILWLFAALLLAVGGLWAGGQSEAKAENQGRQFEGAEINCLFEGHPSSTALETIKGEFEEKTGAKVNIEIIPYAELPQKVLLGFSQGDSTYDVIMNDMLYLKGYADNDYIYELDDFIADPSLNQYYDAADFVKTYNTPLIYNGKTYGVPAYGESSFLMYRKDLFDQYSIPIPQTMSDLVTAAKTIKEKSGGKMAGITLRGQAGVHVVYIWGAFLWGYGGRYFDEQGRLVIDSPEAIKGTEAFVDILNNYGPLGYSNFGWQENRLLFQQGKAGMTIDATVNGAYCEDPDESSIVGKVGYAPVPAETKGFGGPASLAVHALFINKKSKHPDAAFAFASWATNAQTQIQTLSVAPHCGLTSVTAMQSEEFNAKYGAFAADMLKALEVANPQYMPTVPQANEIVSKVGTALSQALVGEKTPAEALHEVCADINANVLKIQ
jgi:ABC-type glycerol-3-phosphate transport system substrate-binding protein